MKAGTDRMSWGAAALCAAALLTGACSSEEARPVAEAERTSVAVGTATEGTPTEAGATITAAALLAALDAEAGLVVLDVRTPEEYDAGHVPGAINIPHDQVGDRLASLDAFRDRDIVVYCRTGRRAALAERELTAAGFEHVLDLEGHMVFWKAHELPLATPTVADCGQDGRPC